MKMPFRSELAAALQAAVCCALALGCTSTIDSAPNGNLPVAPGGSAGASASGGATVGGTSSQPGGGATASAGSSNVGGAVGANGGVTGQVAGAGQGGIPPVVLNPQPFQPAAGKLRRLTRTQFRNAVRDLFGEEVNVAELDADNWEGDFAVIGASSVATSERGVEQYQTAIESVVSAVFADAQRRATFIGCTPGTTANDPCVRSFLQSMGLRAWRRPLNAAELDKLASLAASASTALGAAVEGVRWATVALFTSPNFLYRPELGAPVADGSRRLTGFEVASRLAFLLWNSAPDTALLDDAASGKLDTAEGIRAAAERLLQAPAGRQAIGAFAEEYMRLDRVGTQAKDSGLFPEYTPTLQAAMVRDMRGIWESLAFDDQANALELFTTNKVVVNLELAQLYGLDTAGLDSNASKLMTLPADSPRVGILGRAGFLSQFANQKEGSPTLRGKFIREAFLCMPVQPPPGNIDTVLEEPPVDMPQTKRQRLEQHRTNQACSGCHSLMDPLGLPFETFDAIGRYRTTERGLTIDPSGEFERQVVSNAREFGAAIGASTAVAQCLARKYHSYAMGHKERDVDGTVVNALADSFLASGFKLRQLVLDLVTHQAFSSVAPQQP
jgi:hypothetical protein